MKYILLFGLLIITTMIMPGENTIPNVPSPVKEILYNEDQSQDITAALKDLKSLTLDSEREAKKIEANIPQYLAQKEQTYANLEKLVDVATENQQILVELKKAHEIGNKTINQQNPLLEEIKNNLGKTKTEMSTLQSQITASEKNITQNYNQATQDIKSFLGTTSVLFQKQLTDLQTHLQTQLKQQHDVNNQIMQAWMRKSQLFMTISVAVLALTTSFWMWWHTHKA